MFVSKSFVKIPMYNYENTNNVAYYLLLLVPSDEPSSYA